MPGDEIPGNGTDAHVDVAVHKLAQHARRRTAPIQPAIKVAMPTSPEPKSKATTSKSVSAASWSSRLSPLVQEIIVIDICDN
jgi:hypothetical protein